jgi:hypothetical protein
MKRGEREKVFALIVFTPGSKNKLLNSDSLSLSLSSLSLSLSLSKPQIRFFQQNMPGANIALYNNNGARSRTLLHLQIRCHK